MDELDRLIRLRELLTAQHTRAWEPLPHQIPPDGDWSIWLMLAGRGAGKTDGAARFVTDHVRGPACLHGKTPHRVAVISPTIGDAVEAAASGPSGLLAHDPGARLRQRAGGVVVEWENGSRARLYGCNTSEDVNRLRAGGNTCLWWGDEFAAWRQMDEAWLVGRPGLRHGQARTVLTTTPKRRKLLVKLVTDPGTTITRATTYDNPHLPGHVKEGLRRMYEGTTIGRQELAGELLAEVEGALWRQRVIDDLRMAAAGPMARVVTAIDPQGSEGSGTTGIVAAGITRGACPCGENQDRLPHGFVLADESVDSSPAGWARQALALHHRLAGDRIVAERNFGGDMVDQTLRSVDPNAPVHMVNASRGKQQRAEPIAALYEQGRVHHVGVLAQLEDEMTTWRPDDSWSPNRLDALVWALTALGLSEWREAKIHTRQVAQARI
jgi:phage terminase large subunit-like protein